MKMIPVEQTGRGSLHRDEVGVEGWVRTHKDVHPGDKSLGPVGYVMLLR